MNNKLNADLVSDVSSENKFVTTAEKTAWNAKANAREVYTKKQTDSAIETAIGALDVSSVGGSGKYISEISETDGKISPIVETMDTVPTNGSTKAVTSGGVQASLAEIIDNGAKNLLETTRTSQTIDGVTFTVNDDGTVTIDTAGVASQNRAQFLLRSVTTYPGMQGCVLSGAVQNNQDVQLRFQLGANPWTAYASDSGSGATISSYSDASLIQVYINVPAGSTVSNLVFRPMICTKAEWDISHAYVPYGKTNAELTVENASQQSEINYAVNTGVKNLLKITASSQTHKGVTFTVNDDQTVTVNGTNDGTGASTFVIVPNEQAITIPDGNYILSGCPTGGGASVPFDLRWYMYSSRKSAYDSGNGAFVEKSGNTEASNIAIVVKTGQTTNNLTFKPMIRPAAITDASYQPYARSNPSLTAEMDYVVNTVAKNLAPIETRTNKTNNKWIVGAGSGNTEPINLIAGDYIFTAVSSSTGSGQCQIKLAYSDGTTALTTTFSFGSTMALTFTATKDVVGYGVYSNPAPVTFEKMMIRPVVITDPTFQPYARTNRELTVLTDEDRASLVELVDKGAKNHCTLASGSNTPPARWVNIPVSDVGVGQWVMSFGTLTSTDTDDMFCQAICFNRSDQQVSNWVNFKRESNTNKIFTTTDDVSYVRLYSANSYATSEGDTVTFNNAMLCSAAAWKISQAYQPYRPSWQEMYDNKIDHDLPVVSGSILDYANNFDPGIYFARQSSSVGSRKPIANRRYVYNIYVYSLSTATIMAIEGEGGVNATMFVINKISSSWGSWYKFEGTAMN